jgi:DNA oxidative demethylase
MARGIPNGMLAAIDQVNGFLLLRRFLDRAAQVRLVEACHAVARLAPFITPVMADGRPLRVQMTNAGEWGWLSDREGYRYARCHPATGAPWPAAPPPLAAAVAEAVAAALGARAATAFQPQCYLINRYSPETGRLGLHRDQDERDRTQPIVTLSLGASAVFLAGGAARRDRVERVAVDSGDVVVMSGPTRMAYHGIDRLLPTLAPVTADGSRLSVTVRRVDPTAP